eukprot:653204-Prymnesium_polylepis.1
MLTASPASLPRTPPPHPESGVRSCSALPAATGHDMCIGHACSFCSIPFHMRSDPPISRHQSVSQDETHILRRPRRVSRRA